jgi:hypothetical protein
MGISVIGAAASSGGGGGGDFVINTGDYSSDTAELSTEFAAGAYGITVSPTDSTLDIYFVASDGSFAGYTNTGSITATIPFNKVVVLGSTSTTILSFVFNGESQIATTKGQLTNAGAFVSSVVTSSLPNLDDTTVVNGGNFAGDVEVSFIDQSSAETAAKTVVRSSSTQLLVTRPDSFSPDDSPFTLKVVNPGIPVPAGSNAHLLSNSVTGGTNPAWTTGTNVPFTLGAATNYTLLATDTEATDIDYSIISGTLPAGLTLDGETGVISGTFSGSASEGDVTPVTIRAIDTGGNFLDKAFNFTANVAPTWTTGAGNINDAGADSPYSVQLVASTGAGGGTLTYTLQSGSLLPAHSLSSTGLISGTSTAVLADTATFTVRATDEGGLFADRSFTVTVAPVSATGGTITTAGGYTYHTFLAYDPFVVTTGGSIDYLIVGGGGGGGGAQSNVAAGGGGAGGVKTGTISISPASYGIFIGNGGTGGSGSGSGNRGANGASSSINPLLTAVGGGGGGAWSQSASVGGSGGGGAGNVGYPAGPVSDVDNIGNSGGSASGQYGAGGGGGAGGDGGYASPGGGAGGAGYQWVNGIHYAGGGGGGAIGATTGAGGYRGGGDGTAPGTANTGGGGGGGQSSNGSNGGSGIVIIRYAV